VAGIIARTDASAGVHKAPANERIDGAIDIRIRIDDATQAAMNPKGTAWLNVIRAFPGRGLRVWGARTLSSDPEWNQVSVRRLLLTIGRWLERLAQTVAFEPNNFALWIRINRQVNAYLQELFASGAFKGSKPTEAFFVKCDGELNTAQVRESGRVITEVGVAPIKPNEFIIVRLISNAQDSSSSATA
jgi:phage tail sheath protein FI